MAGNNILTLPMTRSNLLTLVLTATAICSCDNSKRSDADSRDMFQPPEVNGYMLTSLTVSDGNEEVLSRSVYRLEDATERSVTKYRLDANTTEVADARFGLNDDGTIRSQEILDLSTGVALREQVLTYGPDGRLLNVESRTREGVESVEFQYSQGRIETKRITSSTRAEPLVLTYRYSEENQLTQVDQTDSLNGTESLLRLFYDEAGQLERTEFDELRDEEIEETRVFERDSNGNVVTIKYFDEDNSLARSEQLNYEETERPVANLVEFDNFYFSL